MIIDHLLQQNMNHVKLIVLCFSTKAGDFAPNLNKSHPAEKPVNWQGGTGDMKDTFVVSFALFQIYLGLLLACEFVDFSLVIQ